MFNLGKLGLYYFRLHFRFDILLETAAPEIDDTKS